MSTAPLAGANDLHGELYGVKKRDEAVEKLALGDVCDGERGPDAGLYSEWETLIPSVTNDSEFLGAINGSGYAHFCHHFKLHLKIHRMAIDFDLDCTVDSKSLHECSYLFT